MFRFIAFACLLMAAACGPRPNLVVQPEAAGQGKEVTVFFSTTRATDETGAYQRLRNPMPTYGRVKVQVPPQHTQGKVEARFKPDPARDFIATDLARYDQPRDFRHALSARLRQRSPKDREVILFVHGFNNTFGEGVYRMAQLAHDFDFPGVAVHYSWPSAAHLLAYTHDRDSALYSRDGLEELLTELDRAGASRVQIVAHSMGSELVMETLRQISIRSNARMNQLVDGVILIAPDLDVDLFRSQALRIGKLPDPFIVFTSQRDRALAVSARLNGARNRLGNLNDVERVADLDVTLLNISNFGEGLGHFTPGSSPTLIALIRRMTEVNDAFQTDVSGRAGLIPSTVLTVRNATEIILFPGG